MAFSDRLKQGRLRAGLTQEQLAGKLGIAKSTLSGYENGSREPAIATVAKLLDILDIDASYLYQDETLKNVYDNIATQDEFENIIKKYRLLDDTAKEIVTIIIDRELERCEHERRLTERLKAYHILLSGDIQSESS